MTTPADIIDNERPRIIMDSIYRYDGLLISVALISCTVLYMIHEMIPRYGFNLIILFISSMIIGSCFTSLALSKFPRIQDIFCDRYVYKEKKSDWCYIIPIIILLMVIYYIIDNTEDFITLLAMMVLGFCLKLTIHEYNIVNELLNYKL